MEEFSDNDGFGVGDDASRTPKKRKGPRKATKKSLENAALHYLSKFAASSQKLRTVLIRRVERSAYHHGTDAEEGAAWVDEIIARYLKAGLLDDQAFAQMRAESLHRRGTPLQGIRHKLRADGLTGEDIDPALDALRTEIEEPDLAAAIILARKRRLGPYRSNDDERQEKRDRDLGVLARAGFSYDIAQDVIGAETVEELERRLTV